MMGGVTLPIGFLREITTALAQLSGACEGVSKALPAVADTLLPLSEKADDLGKRINGHIFEAMLEDAGIGSRSEVSL